MRGVCVGGVCVGVVVVVVVCGVCVVCGYLCQVALLQVPFVHSNKHTAL